MRRVLIVVVVVASLTGLALALPHALAPRVRTFVGRNLGWTYERPPGFEGTATVKVGERRLIIGERGLSAPFVAPGLRDGDRWLVFPDTLDGSSFDVLQAGSNGGRIIGVLEARAGSAVPLDPFHLIESRDGGDSFSWLATIPRPKYGAKFIGLRFDDDSIEVELRFIDDGLLEKAWWSRWQALLARVRGGPGPSVDAGAWVLVSRDGGRSFALRPR